MMKSEYTHTIRFYDEDGKIYDVFHYNLYRKDGKTMTSWMSGVIAQRLEKGMRVEIEKNELIKE